MFENDYSKYNIENENFEKITFLKYFYIPENIQLYENAIFVNAILDNFEEIPYIYISNYGRLYNIKTQRLRTPSVDKDGYLYITLTLKSGTRVYRAIHRLGMFAFHPIVNIISIMHGELVYLVHMEIIIQLQILQNIK